MAYAIWNHKKVLCVTITARATACYFLTWIRVVEQLRHTDNRGVFMLNIIFYRWTRQRFGRASSGSILSPICRRYPFVVYHDGGLRSAMASQITGVSIVFSTICSGADQRKYQRSALLAFVKRIYKWPVDSPHKRPVTRKLFSIWWRLHNTMFNQTIFQQ